jgi:formylglycine-generating enzyme required for sulfatase activity
MGERKCVRGGSWDSKLNYMRPANRISTMPSKTHQFYGFRVARSIAQ